MCAKESFIGGPSHKSTGICEGLDYYSRGSLTTRHLKDLLAALHLKHVNSNGHSISAAKAFSVQTSAPARDKALDVLGGGARGGTDNG